VPGGAPELTLTITGSKFDNKFLGQSIAFWTTDPSNLHDHGKMLFTTFVSRNQLTAVIPAALLQNPTVVQNDPDRRFYGHVETGSLATQNPMH
jgi:hypothetical protein